MKIVKEESYKRELTPQPWHAKLEEASAFFANRNHMDITSEEGFKSVMATDNCRKAYTDYVASLVTDDAEQRDMISRLSLHSMEDARNPLAASREATDSLANNANYSSLAKLNSWVIVGYTARSKCLELFHTFSSDDPTVSFKYNVSYLMQGNGTKKYIRPNADRDGELATLYDLPVILPDAGQIGKIDHLDNITGQNTNGSEIWLSLTGGLRGNVFDDNGGKYDRTKFTLEKNPRITGIRYDLTKAGIADAATPVGTLSVYADRKTSTGEQQKKTFYNPIEIPYTTTGGANASCQVTILGAFDLDSGDYDFNATGGAITHIQLEAKLTNVANELGSVRSGNYQIVEDFSVDNHPYGTVPVVPEMSDDFNAGGQGVSAVAFFTDQVVSGLANARDQVMERELDNSYARDVKNHPLYAKVGGFKGSISFPLAARLPGGSDPMSWMAAGLKNTIIHHFSSAEMNTYFEDNTVRQWYILGSELDVDRIPDISYSSWDGSTGVGGGAEKYGFQLDGRAGFMDSMNRKVRVIGSHYKRHYQDLKGNRIPMRAVCKSLSLEQPTNLYLPYSFRVYSGISPEYSKRTGLIISARDCIKSMALVQSRITLVGNSDNLYGAICSSQTVNTVDVTPKP